MSRSSRATVGDAWRVQSFLERISGGECGIVTLVGSAPAACGLGAAPQHLLQQLRRRHACDHKLQDLRGATADLEEAALAAGAGRPQLILLHEPDLTGAHLGWASNLKIMGLHNPLELRLRRLLALR